MWFGGQAARLKGLDEEYQRRLDAIRATDEALADDDRDPRIEELDEWYDAAVRGAPGCLYGRAPAGFPWKVI